MNPNHKVLGITGAIVTSLASLMLTSQSAIAQSSIRECLSEFVRQGVSPDKAADLCSSGGLAIAACMKTLMYEQKLVCTRSSCSQLSREDGWGGW